MAATKAQKEAKLKSDYTAYKQAETQERAAFQTWQNARKTLNQAKISYQASAEDFAKEP